MKENEYQKRLIKTLKERFPDCVVLKNDASLKQGIPDLIVLNGEHWAALEVKRKKDAPHRPNQDYYVSKMNDMSYSSFIYPENEGEVLNDLARTFES